MPVSQDIKELKKLDSHRKRLLIVLILVFFAGSVIVGSLIGKFRLKEESIPTTTSVEEEEILQLPATTLSLTPSSGSMKVGETQEISVMLSEFPVPVADIYLTYDSNVITISNIQNGEVFSNMNSKETNIDSKEGLVSYIATVSLDGKEAPVEGLVFTFTIKALKPISSTVISFDPNITIAALDGDNKLGSTVGGVFEIVE